LILNSNGGNVGIGTNDPTAHLHISSGTSGDCVVRLEADTDNDTETDNARIEFISDGGFNTALVGAGQLPFSSENLNALVLAAYQTIFYSGVQNFTDSTNMVERMRITHTGNVGIGTTDPSHNFEVYGSSASFSVDVSNSAGPIVGNHRASVDSLSLVSLGSVNICSDANNNSTDKNIDFRTNSYSDGGTLLMRIQDDGNVGIGTTNPGRPLTVESANFDGIRVKRTTAGGGSAMEFINGDGDEWTVGVGGTGTFGIYTGGTFGEQFTINASGNVGIGTASPDKELHVYGSIQCHNTGSVGDEKGLFLQSVGDWYNLSPGNDGYLHLLGGASGQGHMSGNYSAMKVGKLITYGDVGIGTTSPSYNLDIYSNHASDPTYLRIVGNTAKKSAIILAEDASENQCILEYDGTGSGTGNKFHIYSGVPAWTQKNNCFTYVPANGHVGIGEASPAYKLEVASESATDILYLRNKTNASGAAIRFTDSSAESQYAHLTYRHADGSSYGTGNVLKFTTSETSETLALGGSLHIGVDGKDAGYMTNSAGSGRKNLFIQSTHGGSTSQNYGWWIGAQNQAPTSTDNDLYFGVVRNGSMNVPALVQDNSTQTEMNFTGQHRTFVKDTPTNQLDDKEGLIVVADQNEFIKMSGGVAYGNEAITINESLPLVSLSIKSRDKRCFGVLSTTEDPETRKEVHGNFASLMQKEEGDTRVYVNSVGEGAIWVIDENGTLESGDYITTSNITGYGMKQDDDLLHNYTVAKTLMDCDFNPKTQPKRKIIKEPRMIDYWIRYGDVKITEEEYNTLPISKRKIIENIHYRIDQMEVVKEDPEKELFVHEQREELVNVLDEHGQLQWEDHPTETEKAYKIRYLTSDGQITDESNAVHIAAFVGCTYHCG
jgi:hypothetical protein